ncbi:MAG: hypothetical protein J7M38_04555, partial [Armatimonadetes bacterium]|nr:hypothetical protein [Armatimonadota bacterium]
MRTVIASALLLAAGAMLSAAEPLLTIYRTDVPPKLDGALGDACWRAASTASHFISCSGGGLPGEQTRVRACWDAGNLYLGVEAFDAFLDPKLQMTQRVKAEQSGEDVRVFSDDCIEVFLDPPGEGDFHFAANSADGRWDAKDENAEWDSGWRCVARRGEKSYVLEMAIPFAALGAAPEGSWRASFARERTAVRELSTWPGLQGAFHQPEHFGALVFAETGPTLGPVDFRREGGKYLFTATVAG